jgi:hypothetical protein
MVAVTARGEEMTRCCGTVFRFLLGGPCWRAVGGAVDICAYYAHDACLSPCLSWDGLFRRFAVVQGAIAGQELVLIAGATFAMASRPFLASVLPAGTFTGYRRG